MINHEAILLACRAKLQALSVVSAAVTASASSTGYTRAAGSFLTDGFAVGMEVAADAFAGASNNTAKMITAVSATVLTAAGGTTEAATAVTLSVGVPGDVQSENIHFEPTEGQTYFEEIYLPGPMSGVSLGPNKQLEITPSYVVKVFIPAKTGVLALRRYGDALLTLFAPGTSLTVSGHTAWVRSNPAPFVGPLVRIDGFAVISITVPLRVRTANSI